MKRNDFMEMLEQDIATHKDREKLQDVVECMKEVLRNCPYDAEIDHTKSAEQCYEKMHEFAREHQSNGYYHFNTQQALDFVAQYLGVNVLHSNTKAGFVDLEDFV